MTPTRISQACLIFGTERCKMVTYKLITVKHKDVSFKVWAVGEIDPDFFPTRVKKKIWPANTNHTYIHTYAHPHILGLQGRHSCSAALSFLNLFCLPPRPSLSLIWPISRLAVTRLLPQSQYGSRGGTAAGWATSGKASSLPHGNR